MASSDYYFENIINTGADQVDVYVFCDISNTDDDNFHIYGVVEAYRHMIAGEDEYEWERDSKEGECNLSCYVQNFSNTLLNHLIFIHRATYKVVDFIKDSVTEIVLSSKKKLTSIRITLSSSSTNIFNLLQYYVMQLLKKETIFSSISETIENIANDENCRIFRPIVEKIIWQHQM